MTLIMEAAHEDAEIIFGTVIDESMNDQVKVTVIATGLNTKNAQQFTNTNTAENKVVYNETAHVATTTNHTTMHTKTDAMAFWDVKPKTETVDTTKTSSNVLGKVSMTLPLDMINRRHNQRWPVYKLLRILPKKKHGICPLKQSR